MAMFFKRLHIQHRHCKYRAKMHFFVLNTCISDKNVVILQSILEYVDRISVYICPLFGLL